MSSKDKVGLEGETRSATKKIELIEIWIETRIVG